MLLGCKYVRMIKGSISGYNAVWSGVHLATYSNRRAGYSRYSKKITLKIEAVTFLPHTDNTVPVYVVPCPRTLVIKHALISKLPSFETNSHVCLKHLKCPVSFLCSGVGCTVVELRLCKVKIFLSVLLLKMHLN
jgi:hypothetical protein